jgi:xylulose-5-phosphate/fructose-6-phosphate phosphoketolase
LSEHLCQGWLEGYLLTGRHGLFSCYEAFIHIVDSMVNQHAKWLKTSAELPWRKPIASLNYLLTSHVWRQDHNGFSHQDPGFADFVSNKKADIVRLYFPPDANTLLWVCEPTIASTSSRRESSRRRSGSRSKPPRRIAGTARASGSGPRTALLVRCRTW